MRSASIACVLLSLLGTTRVRAQSLNVDVGVHGTFALPSPGFGGAAAMSGTWNAMPVTAGAPFSAVDLAGAPTGVTLTLSGGIATASAANLVGASTDELALLADVMDPGSSARTLTISGLAPGEYDFYTYALGPDDAAFRTQVSVASSLDPMQVVGGAWAGSFVLGVTHALHRVTLPVTQDVVVTIQRAPPAPMSFNFGSLSGIQILRVDSPGTGFCFGDDLDLAVTTDCPCMNYGAAGRGCANSANATGALLQASGSPLLDTVVLLGTGMPAASACVYLQGDALDDASFGDGVRCVGGLLVRLRLKSNTAGASSFPDSNDTLTLSQRGGVIPGSGTARWYQTYYRNAASSFCPVETFNVTSGWQVIW